MTSLIELYSAKIGTKDSIYENSEKKAGFGESNIILCY